MKLGESPLAALSKLSLLDDVARGTFFVAIVSQLCVPPLPVVAAESMQTEFGLDFTNGEPENLLVASKILISRVASRPYADASAKHALLADLVDAGLPQAAAEWVREAAEAAVLPCAAQLRRTQGHAAMVDSSDYLLDFDWQLNHVLASSSLAKVHLPLVHLHLKVRRAGIGAETAERFELTPAELDAAISSLGAASIALHALPDRLTK